MAPPRLAFSPANWYWVVAGSSTQVYSSAQAAYVPVSDATYQAWLASGGIATVIAAEQDLMDYLTANGVALPAGKTTSDAGKTGMLNNQIDIVIGQILFNHENRIRTLEGKATITQAQFIAGVKALIT